MTFVSKYGFENNISNTNIVKEWYTEIVNDTTNHPIILEAIEDQIEVSYEMYIELKIKIKEICISFSDEVKYLTYILDKTVSKQVEWKWIQRCNCVHNIYT